MSCRAVPRHPPSRRSVFGGRVVPGQALLKALPPLFESKDAKARERVKEIVVRGHARVPTAAAAAAASESSSSIERQQRQQATAAAAAACQL